MSEQEKQKKSNRDLLLILLLLPLGVCLMFAAGQAAIELAASWTLNADMGSGLNPDVEFANRNDPSFIEPILSGILTQPAWAGVYLTPDAVIPGEDGQPVVAPPLPDQPSPQPPAQPSSSPPTSVPTSNPTPVIAPTTVVVVPPTQPPGPKPTTEPPPPEPDVEVDLRITKNDGQSSYTAGSTVVYSVVVTNIGANAVSGATISDNLPSQVASWDWICTSVTNASGCNAVAGSASNFTDTVNIQSGGSIEYTVNAYIKGGAKRKLVNTASVSVPSGYTDTNSGNNSATDTDTLTVVIPSADLAITKTAGSANYIPGGGITFTIEVTNSDSGNPGNASGFNITDNVPAAITGLTVSCAVTGTASCGTNNTSGNSVSFTGASINWGVGNRITITLSGTVASGASGTISNTANIVIPSGAPFTDPNGSNNSSGVTVNPAVSFFCTLSGGSITVPNGGCFLVRGVINPSHNGHLYTITNTHATSSLTFTWNGLGENQTSGTCGSQNTTLGSGNTLNNIAVQKVSIFGLEFTTLTIGNSSGGPIIINVTESVWDTGGCS